LFDYWGNEGIDERIQYLRTFYQACRDATETAVQKHLSGKMKFQLQLLENINCTRDEAIKFID